MIRVLIADDQRINRVLLSRCLDPSKYEVVEAENGQEALEQFQSQRPDVVLLDVMMPVMDGFQAAQAIKAQVGHDDHVPIIMVTSLSDEKSLSQGMEAGADDFIPKPFNRVVLESKLKAALRTRKVFASLRSKTEELLNLHERNHAEEVMAERLMAGVLRTEALSHPMFRYRSRPMDVFNGDLLMAGYGPQGRIRLLLGDFSGHGLAAAIGGLPMVMDFQRRCRTDSLFDIAASANAKLREVLPRERFLAAALLDIDPSSGQVDVLNAGLPDLLVRGADGTLVHRVGATHLPLSILKTLDRPDGVVTLNLQPGERIYLYSDGVTEANNTEGDAYGEDRFENMLADSGPGKDVFSKVLTDLDGFVGEAEASDDVTLVEVNPLNEGGNDVNADPEEVEFDEVSRFHLHLTPAMVREGDIMQLLQAVLECFSSLEGRRADVFAVVAELLNNAMDHGVLGLDSRMKRDISGFAAYYEEREHRLKTYQDGFVDLIFNLRRHAQDWQLQIEVRDSGPGFDLSKLESSADSAAHGRGIEMVRGLCERVAYFEPGNRVEVVYAWATDSVSAEASLESDGAQAS